MELKIALCDDIAAEARGLSEFVKDWAEQNGHLAVTELFPSAESFLFAIEDRDFDVLLLDIEMGGMDGVTLAKKLREQKRKIAIIFVTTHREFYGEGYEVDALHYLIKPVQKDRLFSALSRAAEKLSVSEPPLILSCEGETLRLEKSDLLFAEAHLHYLSIHTEKAEYTVKESISALAERLGDGFFRCHRSYIVSLGAITRISRTSLTLCGGRELPLARGKYDEINRAYIRHFSR